MPRLYPASAGKMRGWQTSAQHLYVAVSGMPVGGVSAHMTSCLDLRDIMNALRIGAIVATESDTVGRRWAETLVDSLNYIDNTLRPLRNRFVHDSWYVDLDKGVSRFTYAPKIVQGQSRQPKTVTPGQTAKQDPREGRLLEKEILTQSIWLSDLYIWYFNRDRWPIEALLSGQPAQRLLPRPPEKQSPSGNAKPRRKPRPRSSPG